MNLYLLSFFAILWKSTLLNGSRSAANAFTPPASSRGIAIAARRVAIDSRWGRRTTDSLLITEGLGRPAIFYSTFQSQKFSHEIFFQNLDAIYTEASSTIRCPFIKRRVADAIDNVAMIVRFLIIRHKSLWSSSTPFLHNYLLDDDHPRSRRILGGTSSNNDHHDRDYMQAPGCKAAGRYIQIDQHTGKSVKHRNLPLETIKDVIIQDWSTHNDKGYYVTGKLNSTIYRDDCLFDGPDPDMPVKGLRKYLGAASHLFDASKSFATLMDVNIVQMEMVSHDNDFDDCYDNNHNDYKNKKRTKQAIEVKWRIEGVLMLPWRPKVKPWSGWTRYHLDADNLIEYHQEGWDISVLEAFVGTMFPTLADKIWKTPHEPGDA
jgi:hypothetical protein